MNERVEQFYNDFVKLRNEFTNYLIKVDNPDLTHQEKFIIDSELERTIMILEHYTEKV